MKRSILIAAIALVFAISTSKAVPPTFHSILTNQLQKYNFLGDYDSCKYVYNEFLKSDNPYFTSDIESLVEVTIFMQDTANAIALFKELLMKTETDTTILSQNPKLSALRTYPQFQQIEQEYENLKLYYYKNFNLKLSQQILEMYTKDRFIRIQVPRDCDCRPTIMEKTDRENFETIKKIVEKSGFPTLSQIGDEAWKGLYIIFLHISALSEQHFQYADSLLKKQVDLFILEPWRYANMVDSYLHFKDIPQRYGTFTVHDKNNSPTHGNIFEPENLDRRRYEIGLNSFTSFSKALKHKKLPDGYKYIDPLQYYFENKENKENTEHTD
ncbi:MAG: hypothetical protein ACOX0M_02535 [Salinivirgaceae bacterium]|jgi:hypothetical protein|nr:hypothetical protein [Bacteroidales bacterium]